MKEQITAKWARETAERILSEKSRKQLEDCLTTIEHCVKMNNMTCSMYYSPEQRVVEELQKRGFGVQIHESANQRDGDSFTISW